MEISKLIRSGSKLPEDVLYAAEFKQGTVYDYVAGTYYCYKLYLQERVIK